MAKIVKHKFEVKEMHCTSCALIIDGNLEDLEGVKKAETSYAKSELEVEYDEEIIVLEEIVASVEKSGYKAKKKEK